nr:hypothetical protein [Dendronalium sp. ChiSLP03b]
MNCRKLAIARDKTLHIDAYYSFILDSLLHDYWIVILPKLTCN